MQPVLPVIAAAVGVAITLWITFILARATSPFVIRRTLGGVLIAAGAGLMYFRAFAPALLLLFVGIGLALRSDAGSGKASRGRTSQVRSVHLEMTLDHDTGDMDGLVLTGRHKGSLLSGLHLVELIQLAAEIRDDAESVRLLETYLDTAHTGWHGRADENTTRDQDGLPHSGGMSREEAYRLLGLEPGASEADIREAYHRIIKRVHPDSGGSAALTAQINEARDRLLGEH